MSGMIKLKQTDLEDSNLSLYGSTEHIEVRLAAAKTEKAWKGAGKDVGIQVWR
jgi:gelsolin